VTRGDRLLDRQFCKARFNPDSPTCQRLHAPYVCAVVVRIGRGRWRSLSRSTANKHQDDERRGEPAWQIHCAEIDLSRLGSPVIR
jgi:hypothetical protein